MSPSAIQLVDRYSDSRGAGGCMQMSVILQISWGLATGICAAPALMRCSECQLPFRVESVRTVLTLSLSRALLENIAQDAVNDDSYGILSNARPSYYT